MSTAPTTLATKSAPRVPPDDAFWERYSPHREFEVSAAGSVALHALALALLGLVAWIAIKLGLGNDQTSLPIEPVVFHAGGNGPNHPRDESSAARNVAPPDRERNDDQATTDGKANPKPPIDRPQLTPDQVRAIEVDFGDAQRADWRRGTTPALDSLLKLDEETRKTLARGLKPGSRGAGRDGKDTGIDKGKEPGKHTVQKRRDRILRWALTFNTTNGTDYARQLAGFDAILALREGEKFRVIRDLSKRPARGEIEDVTKIDRIFWIDDKPASVQSLARALEWPEGTSYFVAFFPEKLEKRLLDLEMDFAKKQYGPKVQEEEIDQTKFRVVKNGDRHDVQVMSVEMRPR